MKKILAMISCVLVLALLGGLSGCAGAKGVEQTNKQLSVYYYAGDMMVDPYIKSIMKQFEHEHPEVEVSLYDPTGGDSTMSVEQATKRLQNDLMNGNGPDIIFDSGYANIDFYKLMQAGKLLDVAPYLEQWDEFNADTMYLNLFESVRFKGQQLATPFMYLAPNILVSTEENLKRYGFDLDTITTTEGFLQEALRCVNEKKVHLTQLQPDTLSLPAGYYLDQDSSIVKDKEHEGAYNLEQTIFKQSQAEAIPQQATYTKTKINGKDAYESGETNPQYNVANVMKEYPILFAQAYGSDIAQLAALGEKLVFTSTVYNANGPASIAGQPYFAYVMKDSANQANAVELIKSLLSQKIQTRIAANTMPVRRDFTGSYASFLKEHIQDGYVNNSNTSENGGPYVVPSEEALGEYEKICRNPADLSVSIFMPTQYTMLNEDTNLVPDESFSDYIERMNKKIKFYISE